MRLTRRRRTCFRLMSAAFLGSFMVFWFYGINSTLKPGRSRNRQWPEYVDDHLRASLVGGGASKFEDRWAKYSLNISIRLAAIERLNALQPVTKVENEHMMLVKSIETKAPVPISMFESPYNPLDEPLMSANLSGSVNEQLRKKLLHIDAETVRKYSSRIWWQSSSTSSSSDRILAQMHHIPQSYRRMQMLGESPKIKSIYVDGGFEDIPMGREKFQLEECAVDACNLTNSLVHIKTADLRLFQASATFTGLSKPPGQIWAIFLLESPANTPMYEDSQNLINWTATYRSDSTIVTPYAKFVPYRKWSSKRTSQKKTIIRLSTSTSRAAFSSAAPSVVALRGQRNFAQGKTKKVAWFVSNCNARNNRREYVEELSKYIPIDMYGACGSLVCARSDVSCVKMLNDQYKFYISFENSNCDYYLTEKFFENALLNTVVPIVMGGRKADYDRASPRHSFIHVDQFPSARDLANYLHRLDQDDHLYNAYFAWKGTGEFINTKFWCRLCALLHDDSKPRMWYTDFNKWWSHDGACRYDRWN